MKAANECAEYYHAMQREHKYRWITFKPNETETELVVDQSGDINSTYQSFLDSLPQQDIRWALMDFKFRTARGPSSKLLFINWVPDAIKRQTLKESARVKSNGVMWAAVFKGIFKEIQVNVQANDYDDLEWGNVLSKAGRHEKDPIEVEWRPAQDLKA